MPQSSRTTPTVQEQLRILKIDSNSLGTYFFLLHVFKRVDYLQPLSMAAVVLPSSMHVM